MACRATIYLPFGWPYLVVCLVLRFTEGVGTALYSTAAYTLVNKLYPESVGFVMVSDVHGYRTGHTSSICRSMTLQFSYLFNPQRVHNNHSVRLCVCVTCIPHYNSDMP